MVRDHCQVFGIPKTWKCHRCQNDAATICEATITQYSGLTLGLFSAAIMRFKQPPKRYAVIDLPGLVALCGFSKLADFTSPLPMDRAALHSALAVRDTQWSDKP
jgi:hypothetical protein